MGFTLRFFDKHRRRGPCGRLQHAKSSCLKRLEELEPRLMMAVGAEEQYLVYLLNRARHDPVAYQLENNLPVDLSYVTPRGPLAVNNNLFNSAEFHANEMAVHNYFDHQSAVTGDWPNKMARDAGYVLDPAWPNHANYIESLAAGTFYSGAPEPLEGLIVDEGINPPGHRNHLLGIDSFSADNREIGVGHAFNSAATFRHYWAIHATRTNPADRFLTGVVFNDANGNLRYDLNEGLANVNVSAGPGLTTTTNVAGGWSLEVSPGTYTVTAGGGAFIGTATATASVGTENVEVDFISGRSQGIVNFGTVTTTASISDVTVTESSGAIVNAVFNVSLGASSTQTITISYATGGNTATPETDFTSQSGVLTFAPGTLTQRITIAVAGDLLDEPNENFVVNLTGASGVSLVDRHGVGLIIDDDDIDPQPNNIFVVAPSPGRPAQVRVLNRSTGAEKFSFLAYDAAFLGGAQVATGDVTGDGVLDIIVAPGAGGGPHVRTINGATGNEVAGPARGFFAFDASFSGGLYVAAGDLDGDSRADIVTAAGAGGGPHVRIFSGRTGGLIGEYFAYAAGFNGGVRVAVGDVDGNGTRDVITAPGAGGGPHIRVFSGATGGQIAGPAGSFFAYGANFTGGVYVAAGDLNGDLRADIITGPGAGGGPHVRAFSGLDLSDLANFFAYAANFTGGVRVAAGDFTGDSRDEIIVGPGSGGGPHVRVFHGQSGAEIFGLFAYEPNFAGGVHLAGSPPGTPLVAGTAHLAPTFSVDSETSAAPLDSRRFSVLSAGRPAAPIDGVLQSSHRRTNSPFDELAMRKQDLVDRLADLPDGPRQLDIAALDQIFALWP